MKTLPLLLLTALVATAQFYVVPTNYTIIDIVAPLVQNQSASNVVAILRTSGQLSNVVQELRVTGEVCKSAGRHSFRDGRPGEGEGSSTGNSWYLDHHPFTSWRTCRVCGRVETQSTAWSGPPDVIATPQFPGIPYWTNGPGIGLTLLTNGNFNVTILTNGATKP